MKLFNFSGRGEHSPDYVIVSCVFILIIFGLVMLASASSDLGKVKFNDSYFYLKHQLMYGLSIGIIGFYLASKFYYRNYEKIATPLLFFSLFILLLVFTSLGKTSGGATRWLQFGSFVFQPSELLKITFIFYLASWLRGSSNRQKSFWAGFVPFMIISGIVAILLIMQPSTSFSVILMIVALMVYFVSGAKVSYIFSAVALGLIILAILFYSAPYRLERVKTFLNPEINPQSSSYQINQAMIAIGSGGLWGKGFGKSVTKISSLPQPIDDSIFAIIAEELGFVGTMFLISIFITLVIRTFILSKKITDDFGKLLLVGFGSLIAIQVFINMGAISGLLPLTGMPLPFISYGGTALAVFMTISGIMVNISKYS